MSGPSTPPPLSKFTNKSLGDLFSKLFPDIYCPLTPFGAGVLVQIASPLDKTDGGIHLTTETKEFQRWNQKLAKVLKLGPVAFKDRETMVPWPEGNWCNPGDYVRVRQYSGDRVEINVDKDIIALFAVVQDRELGSGFEEGFNPFTLRGWV